MLVARQNFRSRELGLILGRATSSRATRDKHGAYFIRAQ